MLEMSQKFLETADLEISSEDYAKRFVGEVGEWFLSIQLQATLRMLAPYPGATILDVGGGHGQITEALVRRQFDVTVAGSSDQCKARIKPLVDRELCTFDVVDFLHLPYKDKAFGVVICYRFLPHVKHWQQFLAEMARVAERCVILDYPEKHSVHYFSPHLVRLKRRLEGNSNPYRAFTQREIRNEFRKYHFLSSEQYSEFFLPMLVHHKLKMLHVSEALERSARQMGLTRKFGSPRIIKFIREQQLSQV
jgi:ubiquinone/menaquinone biosynthesis C-methylase UbiE